MLISFTGLHKEKLLISKQHWNPSKNNGSLLWLKIKISNRYIDGSESIPYFRRLEEIKRMGVFFNQLKKESSWIQAAPRSMKNVLYQIPLYKVTWM